MKLVTGLALLGATALAACGNGNTVEVDGELITPEEALLRVFSDDAGDASDALEAGETLTARSVGTAALRERYPSFGDTDGSFTPVGAVVSIQKSGPDLLLTYQIDGEDPTDILIPGDLDDSNYRVENGEYIDIWLGGGTFASLYSNLDGDWMHQLGIYHAPGGGYGNFIQSWIGTETSDANLDELAMANAETQYFGWAYLQVYRSDMDWSHFNARVDGELEMMADFAAGTIGGTWYLDDFRVREGEEWIDGDDLNGTASFDTATMQGNAFQGTITPDADFLDEEPDLAAVTGGATYSGAFYGDQAQQVGGVIELDTENGGNNYVGIGNWDAWWD